MADTGDVTGIAALIATLIGYPLAWRYGKGQEAKRQQRQSEAQAAKDESDSLKTLSEALLGAHNGTTQFAGEISKLLRETGELTGKVSILEGQVKQLTEKVQEQAIALKDAESKRAYAEAHARELEDLLRETRVGCDLYRMGFEAAMMELEAVKTGKADPLLERMTREHIENVLRHQEQEKRD